MVATTGAFMMLSSSRLGRRIERDLHDGVHQHLTSLPVRLLLAAKLAGQDAELAGLLEQLGAEVRGTTQELQRCKPLGKDVHTSYL